ncbi:uncharacterized protein [Diadema setosum]|uniref:uncharacterized protein n=1 Tax=Diadema setosum TaxID=31175 RepID=UPI003B3A19E4
MTTELLSMGSCCQGTGNMGKKIVLFVCLMAGLSVNYGSAQLVALCDLVACLDWCGCNGGSIDISNIRDGLLFGTPPCEPVAGFDYYNSCGDGVTAVIAPTQIRSCEDSTENVFLFRNETVGNDHALVVWESQNPAEKYPVREYCFASCNPKCGITIPPTTPVPPPTTTKMNTRAIDEIIPRFSPDPVTTEPGNGAALSKNDARLVGIIVGAFLAGVFICVIIVLFCYNKRKHRRPKLPPRRPVNNGQIRDNRDYATIEEIQMTSTRSSPRRIGGAFPNLLYRSESLSAMQSMSRSRSSDIDDLGDAPQPPVRQLSLLPGVNPALADDQDGQTASLDVYGYTKYQPDAEAESLPYMHLKVTSTKSDPAPNDRRPVRPHRYRSNTTDTHASAADVDRMLARLRAREAVRGGANRRFVPNQSGTGRRSTVEEEYNRLARSGHKAVPRSKKSGSGAFTPIPVHGLYHSRNRKSQESMRKWKSLPDMTGGGSTGSMTDPIVIDDGTPIYQLLESSRASSVNERETYNNPGLVNSTNQPNRQGMAKPQDSSATDGRNVGTNSSPSTLSNGLRDRYDPVYESGAHKQESCSPESVYQPLALPDVGQDEDDFDDGAYQGSQEWLDSEAYLSPKTTNSPGNGQSIHNSIGRPQSPAAHTSNNHHSDRPESPAHQSYIYESDNNNLSTKTKEKYVDGNTYTALKMRPNDHVVSIDDDEMENGEYMSYNN